MGTDLAFGVSSGPHCPLNKFRFTDTQQPSRPKCPNTTPKSAHQARHMRISPEAYFESSSSLDHRVVVLRATSFQQVAPGQRVRERSRIRTGSPRWACMMWKYLCCSIQWSSVGLRNKDYLQDMPNPIVAIPSTEVSSETWAAGFENSMLEPRNARPTAWSRMGHGRRIG